MFFIGGNEVQDFLKLNEAIDAMGEDPACRMDPDLFFPEAGAPSNGWQVTLIKSVCNKCPIQDLCRDYGMKYVDHGYWGGVGQEERRQARRKARDLAARAERLKDSAA